MNQVILIGRVGKDPELRKTNGGTSIAIFPMATSWKSGDKEYTEWHRVRAWGNLAESVAERVRKGDKVTVVGRNKTDPPYTDNEGNKKYNRTCVEISFYTVSAKYAAQDAQGYGGEQTALAEEGLPY